MPASSFAVADENDGGPRGWTVAHRLNPSKPEHPPADAALCSLRKEDPALEDVLTRQRADLAARDESLHLEQIEFDAHIGWRVSDPIAELWLRYGLGPDVDAAAPRSAIGAV